MQCRAVRGRGVMRVEERPQPVRRAREGEGGGAGGEGAGGGA